jgi:uncharacterized Tic20 family protein
MDQNPQQPNEMPPASAPGPSAGMPPTMNYPTSTGGGMVSQEEKTQAMLVWLLGIPIGFISPLIFYLISKDKPFVYRTAAQALAFHIAIFCALVLSGFLIVVLIGLFLYPLVLLFALIISIMGAIASNKGEEYIPPLTGGLAKAMFKV